MTNAGASARFLERFHASAATLPLAGKKVYVGFSGGIDSLLLLHLLRSADIAGTLAAIHVDHGLHPDSAAWAARCAEAAADLGIAFFGRRLVLDLDSGRSIEAVARDGRYRAFAEIVGDDGALATAHHADDQLETVLLRVFRGTGVRGLSAIPAEAAFGNATLVRPLLTFTRAEIEAEANRRGLRWIEDPSNRDLRFDRNYLRARVLPAIKARWPAAPVVAARLAARMGEAEGVLTATAAADLEAAADLARIPLEILEGLTDVRVGNALRHALRVCGLPVPTTAQLGELRRVLRARHDAEARVSWPGAEARLHRRVLYLLRPVEAAPPVGGRIDPEHDFRFAEGELALEPSPGYGIPEAWARRGLEVGFRRGGERLRPHGRQHRRSLKDWFREEGIVPWMRARVPLLFFDGQLIAVADLCLAADIPQTPADGPFWRPVWRGHGPLG